MILADLKTRKFKAQDKGQMELLQLDDAGIKVAQYFTELPSKEVLKRYLNQQKLIAERQIEDMTDKE